MIVYFIVYFINLRGVSTNKTIICFIAMQTYKELILHSVGKALRIANQAQDRMIANSHPLDPALYVHYIIPYLNIISA
jgi:hypothetical protein